MKKLVIGVTGGIGSGKSTVSQIYENEGFIVLKADDIAKQIMSSDRNLVQKIKNTFGENSYIDDRLNTKYLAEIVFSNEEKIKKLNSIVHPPMISEIKNEIKNLQLNNNLIFVEAALIFEANMQSIFNYILIVTADEEIRVNRVQLRDNDNLKNIKKRIANQLSEKEKIAKSHFIIENNGSLDELKSKSLFFLKLFQNL
jgi:dephospho-CoA kinase